MHFVLNINIALNSTVSVKSFKNLEGKKNMRRDETITIKMMFSNNDRYGFQCVCFIIQLIWQQFPHR